MKWGDEKMGFKNARERTIRALESGDFQFEERAVVEGKNLLDTGDITDEQLVQLLKRCRGTQYEERPHLWDHDTMCHVFFPEDRNQKRWYIKVYFLSDSGSEVAVFISVHRVRGSS